MDFLELTEVLGLDARNSTLIPALASGDRNIFSRPVMQSWKLVWRRNGITTNCQGVESQLLEAETNFTGLYSSGTETPTKGVPNLPTGAVELPPEPSTPLGLSSGHRPAPWTFLYHGSSTLSVSLNLGSYLQRILPEGFVPSVGK